MAESSFIEIYSPGTYLNIFSKLLAATNFWVMCLSIAHLLNGISIVRAPQPGSQCTNQFCFTGSSGFLSRVCTILQFTEHMLLLPTQYASDTNFFFVEGHSNLCPYLVLSDPRPVANCYRI